MKKLILIICIIFGLFSFKNISEAESSSSALFGIDVSHYQGHINWPKVKTSKHNVQFVLIRATMGSRRKDSLFERNCRGARKIGCIIGAYHYYDPNEPSAKQAANYLKAVKLQGGDIIPVVDLERLSKIQSTTDLKSGLKNWLDIVEKKYGVKPMIYTGYSFYQSYLAKDFAEYPLWVAAYSPKKKKSKIVVNSEIHQFSEKVKVPGIKGKVDGNHMKKSKINSVILKG